MYVQSLWRMSRASLMRCCQQLSTTASWESALFARCAIPSCWGWTEYPLLPPADSLGKLWNLHRFNMVQPCASRTEWKDRSPHLFFNVPPSGTLARDAWVDFNRFWSRMLFTSTQWPWHHHTDPHNCQLDVQLSSSTPWWIRLRLFATPRWSWPSTRLRPCKRLVGHNWSSIAEMGTLEVLIAGWCRVPLSVSYCCLLIQTRTTIPPFCMTTFNVGHGWPWWNYVKWIWTDWTVKSQNKSSTAFITLYREKHRKATRRKTWWFMPEN